MMARRRLGGFALAVALGLIAVARAAPAQWETYTKPRFGTIADYPVDLLTVQLPPPENRDGASFCTTDGRAQLSIYGAYNVDSDMPQSYVAKFDHLNGAAYKRVTPLFYAVSGTSGADIYYERCNFPPHNYDVMNCVHITHRAQEKAVWDSIMTASPSPCGPVQR
jgi:hypothetical protein